MKQTILRITLMILMFASCATVSQSSGTDVAKSSVTEIKNVEEEANIQKVRSYWEEVWGKGNLQAVADFYHPNAKHGDDFTIEGFQKGVAFQREAFPDFKATITDIFASGDKVITEVIYTGTHTGRKMFRQDPLGKAIKVPGLDIFTFKDGKCVNHQHVADHLDLVMQMGIKLQPFKDPKILEQDVRKAGIEYNELMKHLKSGQPYEELEKSGAIAALDSLLAKEYIYTSRDGVASDKKESLEDYKNLKLNLYSADMLNQEVRIINNDAAVETGTVRYRGINNGKAFDITKRYTTTWVWRNNRWQIIADHTTLVK
ncbi:Predicted ester cyclase [Flavobacteriaceae bacterium MAR_2010_188]|nr:Predicted ester cyclase [Flavobacteriaceae bacterium MAR_2010_188]